MFIKIILVVVLGVVVVALFIAWNHLDDMHIQELFERSREEK